ncbi:3347_t:CDS:2, partial [Paraglomus brasilianum]
MSSPHTDNPDTDVDPFRFVINNMFELNLTDNERVSLSLYFTKFHDQAIGAAEVLPHFRNAEGKIKYLRSLLQLGKRKASEEKTIPSKYINMHIGAVNVTHTDVGRFWEALQLMEIDDEDMFLSLPTGIFFCDGASQ